MKKYGCLLFILLMSLSGRASHIVGGQLSVEQLNDSLFAINLVIYRDCAGILPRLVYSARIFRQSDSSHVRNAFLDRQPGVPVAIGDTCFSPVNLCVESWLATDTIVLQPESSGYFLVVQEYARNPGIVNVQPGNFPNVGMTWLTKIPDPALAGGNTTPLFSEYPRHGYLCINQLHSIDLSATDPDGDSLAYRLVTPLEGHPDASQNTVPQVLPKNPPYNPVNWAPGFSLNQVTPGPVPLQIDPVTGVASAETEDFGLYVFSYVTEEYRNGVKIGETRRDLQVEVLDCEKNAKPFVAEPQRKHFDAELGEESCIRIRITDPNADDSMYVSSSYTWRDGSEEQGDVSLLNRPGRGQLTGQVCWTPNCAEILNDKSLRIHLRAISWGCDAIDTIYDTLQIRPRPLPNGLEDLFPNIFTPNGDGVNDYFRLADERVNPCIEGLDLRIYNRWGTEVYRQRLGPEVSWDGTFQGRDLPEGVYFYLVSGQYNGQSFRFQDHLTLKR